MSANPLWIVAFELTLLLLPVTVISSKSWKGERYCSARQGQQCCPGRDDLCTVTFFDTVCYCDIFCNRTQTDCCPDFLGHCIIGIEPQPLRTKQPPATFTNNCFYGGRLYEIEDRITVNCNNCTCEYAVVRDEFNWKCTQKSCLIRPDMLHYVNVNSTKHGWTASNYSAFWGLTLEEGVKRRLGTKRPSSHVTQMFVPKASPEDEIPAEFDARKKWPKFISPVLDQKDCSSSWAFSTSGVASDRLRIHSNGMFNATLSPQHLISCDTIRGQQGCGSGHIERAWWFIRKVGIVSDDCFRYSSGETMKSGSCPFAKSSASLKHSSCPSWNKSVPVKVYQATASYRIAPKEYEIMKEIRENGPLQVVMEVKADFYMYRSGVYHHSLPADYLPLSQRHSNFHSVRLIGWGVDNSTRHPLKYWLCANSWGTDWGEDGYFRILRGTDESSIESYVVGARIKVDDRTLVKPRRRDSTSASAGSSVFSEVHKGHEMNEYEN